MKLRIARARGVDAAAVVVAVSVARAAGVRAGVGKRRPYGEEHEDQHLPVSIDYSTALNFKPEAGGGGAGRT
jgi:hypothetical protein